MGWGRVRQQVYEKQGGLCSICGRQLVGRWEIHHKVNRSQGRVDNSLRNAEARCPECEDYMHANYPFGNYEGNLKKGGDYHVIRERRRKDRFERKGKRTKMPPLQGGIPHATFRQVSPNRPLPPMRETVPSDCQCQIDDLNERLKRLENMLIPCS